MDPSESRVALDLGSLPLCEVQRQLDQTRAANPDSPIALTLTGIYKVSDTPLTLPSKTSLVLYGTIEAAQNATASTLIAISGQSQVAVAGGLLEGNGAKLSGITVQNSTKINLDAVTVRDTGLDGIILQGAGNDIWNSGSAITRCEVVNAGGNGITIGSITQALVLDGFVHGNGGAGIQVSAAYSSVVNNVSQDNDVGILVDANDNLISDNLFQGNRSGGLRLAGSSAKTAVARNSALENSVLGIDLDGSNNLLYANDLRNSINLAEHAAGNWVVPIAGMSLQAPLSQYFYPPTIDNRHSEPVMNGRNRFDLTVDASASPTISQAQQAYDTAREQHPDDVIVLTLKGLFTLDDASLLLQSHTAMILDGAITAPSSSKAAQVITAANPSEFISISGGTIELSGRSAEGIFLPSTTMAYIDHVTVKNGGQRDVRAGKGMIHLARGGGYNILHANTVDNSGGRCVWTQNSNARYVVLENYLTNCNQDGVDFDSSTSNSLAIGNTSVDNVRYGVFIEQSDSLNKIYGNTATTRGVPSIPGHAVGIYNNATSSGTRGVTDKNTVFCNSSDVIADGLRVGSIATATGGVAETAHSFLFNNVAKNSRNNGILFDTQFTRSVQNYFSQTVMSGNKTDLNSQPSNGAAPPEFFNPPSAINLAYHQPTTASSSAPGSSPDAAVDGLAFTSWIAGDEDRSFITVDLGAEVSFQRVMLRPIAGSAVRKIKLQRSDDGVKFTEIPGSDSETKRTINITFRPVTARFLRVEIREKKSEDGPAGFEEISAHAK
ncbi:MAG TPA: right-handed parallel beta-helix repeat-containing protein [Blastocatellia bacterium]|nr:right-handed parallel beta-helix repeat-containing protein [Blastocatellia bacterium]